MKQPVAGGVASIVEQNEVSQSQQDQVIVPISIPHEPTSPILDLLQEGYREEYIEFGIPLYEALIKADWRAAKELLDEKPYLIRCIITENGDTALHVAASAKRTKRVVAFVQNLVDKMEKQDLELKNKSSNTALCLAAAAGNVEMVKIMVEKNRGLLVIPGSQQMFLGNHGGQQMLPLYIAVLFGEHDVVEYLYDKSEQLGDDNGWWNPENRAWLLHHCVEGDLFDIALRIVEDRPELASNASVLRILAKKPGAFSGESSNFIKRTINWAFRSLKARTHGKESHAPRLLRIILKNIVRKSKVEIDHILKGPPDSIESGSGTVVQTILQQLIFDHLDQLEKEAHKIMEDAEPEHVLLLKHFLSKHVVNLHAETQSLVNQYNISDEDQARKTQQLISEYIVKILNETQRLFERGAGKEDQAQKLRNLISGHIAEMRRKTIIKKTYSSRVMFIAAEVGNTNFLLELISGSPDLIWNVNDNNQTIFHVAVKHRNQGIYNLLYEIGAMKDMVTPMTDRDGNNMLHLAAMSTRKKNLEDVSGAALQMQRDLLWFKEVERMIPPSFRERKNKDGFTPRELFTKEHQDLITQGEKWMKSTASQCMVVATLIATIVFAAAFTVPGGYDQNDGIPMFKRKLSFVAFVVADAISLFLSTASILTFLSILTSRYAERDFVASLPMKLMLGLATLFLSIGAMMVTFSVSFFVLYHREMKWIPIFISLFAVTPAILYVALQYYLLVDVIRSTYGGRYLFKSGNQVLFYENPKY